LTTASTYLTDSWSSLSGLAAVAYGSPDLYAEVADQVRRGSVVSFVDSTPPSALMGRVLPPEAFLTALQSEYGKGEDFADYVDAGGRTVTAIANELYGKLISSFDQFATYETSLSDSIEYVTGGTGINSQRVKKELERLVPDLQLYGRISASTASRKLDKLPAGTRITLGDTVPSGKDYRGVDLALGYLTPPQHFGNVPFPGVRGTFDNLPASTAKSIEQGYVGYATLKPLSEIFRSGLTSIVGQRDISDIANVSRSISGLGTLDTLRDLSGVGSMSSADRAMYEVDLTAIVIARNGYTVYDPSTDSNGDFIDLSLAPDFDAENSDEDKGLASTERTRSATF
jgi:hypothetical protein